ncbi:hypothetical protein Pr1d_35160 [Bythopirellula goksoeyrii]|uniref:Helix-turn-helix domain protein n=1 Tax=Bythopirellula goksoeyrii TaxID=1400387 RepID=A0A5B9QAX6_9BACT|nr:hypothetical protein Pr1d_35160 [Bythopirellula goksoeyrii]
MVSSNLPHRSHSIGQVAKKWGISPERVRQLILTGKLGAFEIPSAGKYGKALRIPHEYVEAAEMEWAVESSILGRQSPQRSHRNTSKSSLRHFPELRHEAE